VASDSNQHYAAYIFDQFQNGYYIAKEKVGKAWNAGADLMKK
jgi:hypothetical protein